MKTGRRALSAVMAVSFLVTGFLCPVAVRADTGSLPAAGTQVKLYLRSIGDSIDNTGDLSFSAGAAPTADTIPSANGGNYDGSPKNPDTYEFSGLAATYDGSLTTQLQAYLNSLSAGNGTQIQIRYDFNGDGKDDALQCYGYFATDGSSTSWEQYPTSGLATYGTMADFAGGTVKVQVWNAIGNGASQISVDSPSDRQSYVTLPFRFQSYTEPTPPATGVTPAKLPPMPVPDAYPSEAVSGNWKNELGAARLSSTPQAPYSGSDGYLHITTPQAAIHKTSNMTGATPTNSWESSVVFQSNGLQPLYTLPLASQCLPAGLGVEMPGLSYYKGTDNNVEVLRQYDAGSTDMVVGGSGLTASDISADKISDWSADILMASPDGSKSMKATLTKGSPYIYFSYANTNPQITFSSAPLIISGADGSSNQLEIRTNGQYYGLFAPAGAAWGGLGTTAVTCSLPSGKNYFSIALLPDASADTFHYYADHAYAFVTNTEVRWRYNESDSTVETSYLITTEAREGTDTDTITALIPSQWYQNDYLGTLPYTYDSIRGVMKTTCGTMFQTKLSYSGILPNFPDTALQDGAVKSKMQTYISALASASPLISGDANNSGDTYYIGKGLGKIANALAIAEQTGDASSADTFEQGLKDKIDDFFTYSGSSDESYFYYDGNWGTLIGYPASFGSDNELNDHYFHYGYFIYAAAQLALRDANWASDSEYGKMVKLLIKDIANADRNDTRFPFLRSYDAYEGHSWASGDAPFTAGNNQESSSECINAWAGIILFGEATGDTNLRDLGIFLYTNETNDVNMYNFDLEGITHDIRFPNEDASQIWGAKYNHATWWTSDPIEAHGINMLPVTASSFYLGKDKSFVRKNYDSVWTEYAAYAANGGSAPETMWQDILCEYYAFYDPADALGKWDDSADPEPGGSKAHTYDYLESLNALGTPCPDITADTPLYAVFDKNGVKTYAAYNATGSAMTVTFSDGTTLGVPANSMAKASGGGTEQQVSKPTFSVPSGTYTSAQSVAISCATSGASIYYTTDGTTPTASSTLYTGAITVSSSETIKAIAVRSGMTDSAVASAAYTISSGNPGGSAVGSFTAAAGLSGTTLTVTLVPESSGDTCANLWWYNGTDVPTLLSQATAGYAVSGKNADGNYVVTIPDAAIPTTNIIYLYLSTNSGDTGWAPMTVRSASVGQTAAPTFTPAGGTYTSAQSVTISCATSGASICYTTDGTVPTASSTLYTGAITVSSSETIKAIAVRSGMTDSAVASAAYTISSGNPGGSAVGSFTAAAGLSGTTLTVTLVPESSGDTCANLWWYNGTDVPTLLSQATAGYAVSGKNADGNYVVTIPDAAIPSTNIIYLYLSTNSGDTGWVPVAVG